MSLSECPDDVLRDASKTTLTLVIVLDATFGISHDGILIGPVDSCTEGFLRMRNSNYVEKSCDLDWIVAVIALSTFCFKGPMPAI